MKNLNEWYSLSLFCRGENTNKEKKERKKIRKNSAFAAKQAAMWLLLVL